MIRWYANGMKRFLLAIILTTTPFTWLAAHPHGWIDFRVNVLIDNDGQLTGLEQRWQMDPFYSLALLEELALLGADERTEAFAMMADEIQHNLTAEQYNTDAWIGEQALSFGPVEVYELREENQHVVFAFTLPISEPVSMAGQVLKYQIFEPTYFLEMLHEAKRQEPIAEALTVQGPISCETRIIPANPDPKLVMEAAQLGIDEEGEHGLGRYFADTGEVRCQ